ncbi:MAG: hypothetical protein IKO15_00585 [Clostridiales bacterium]|nr:hypothetical protein [Clostridiales bacterium]
MKKISALILSAVMAASVIAGCSNEPATSESFAALTETTTVATGETTPVETYAQEPQTFDELYGPQLSNYLDHQYYFEGEAIPLTESNFYFINTFMELSNYANMGYYPATTLGFLDLSAEFTGEGYATYGDYFIACSEKSIQSTFILSKRAQEAGVTLSDDNRKAIDDTLENMKKVAADSGMSFEQYIQLYYGPGNDEASFRKIFEKFVLIQYDYPQYFCSNYEFTAGIKESVPNIRYALFSAPQGSDQSVLDSAYEAASAMKNECKSIDDLTGLAATAQSQGLVLDQGDILVPKGQTVAKFEEWAYGEGRTEGELDVIYAPEYGYFVVGYLGLEDKYYVPAIRYALYFAPDSAEQADKDKALELATALKDSCSSVDDLYYLPTDCNDSGDIQVAKGETDAAFEEWAYDEARTAGEMDIIYVPEKGYYVVGYLGLQAVNNDYAMNELSKSILAEVDSGIYDLHTDDVFNPAPAAPTPTDVPTIIATESAVDQAFDPNAVTAADPAATAQGGSVTTADVLVVVFITLAAVAVLAVIIILVVHAMKNNNKSADDSDDEDEDEEDEKPAKKSSKAVEQDDDEDEESDEDEEEDKE